MQPLLFEKRKNLLEKRDEALKKDNLFEAKCFEALLLVEDKESAEEVKNRKAEHQKWFDSLPEKDKKLFNKIFY